LHEPSAQADIAFPQPRIHPPGWAVTAEECASAGRFGRVCPRPG